MKICENPCCAVQCYENFRVVDSVDWLRLAGWLVQLQGWCLSAFQKKNLLKIIFERRNVRRPERYNIIDNLIERS